MSTKTSFKNSSSKKNSSNSSKSKTTKRRTLSDYEDNLQNIGKMSTRKTRKSSYNKHNNYSLRKKTSKKTTLYSIRNEIQDLLTKKNFRNNRENAEIVSLAWNAVKEVHFHIWKDRTLNKFDYHVKATFTLNNYHLILGYDKNNNLIFKIKHGGNNNVIRKFTILNKKGIQTFFANKGIRAVRLNQLMNYMIDVATIIEMVVDTHNINVGGYKKKSNITI